MAGVTVSKPELTVKENASNTWTVVLAAQPEGRVTVAVAKQAGGDPDLAAAPPLLYFSTANWNVPQTVTVRAGDDQDADDGAATFDHGASGGGYDGVDTTDATVTATEEDDDQANAAPVFSSAADVSVAENAALVVTVTAEDADSDDEIVGYAITGGADRGRFRIDGGDGALRFRSAPDFETPADVVSTVPPGSAAGDNEYIVAVSVTSGEGARELTADQVLRVTVTDVDEPPDAPDAPSVSARTDTEVTVTWSAPQNSGPAITDYDVQYRVGGSGSWSDAGHEGVALAATLSGLTAATGYQVQVRANNAEGNGAWSASTAVRTTPAPPGPPTALTTTPGDRAVTLSWTAPRRHRDRLPGALEQRRRRHLGRLDGRFRHRHHLHGREPGAVQRLPLPGSGDRRRRRRVALGHRHGDPGRPAPRVDRAGGAGGHGRGHADLDRPPPAP